MIDIADLATRRKRITGVTGVREFLAGHRNDIVEQLSQWSRIPSVAGVAEHEIDLVRSAHWLAAALRDIGFPTVEVWDTCGPPAVHARWHAAPDAPTVLVYSHHDVRAVRPEQWRQTAPFEPVLRDGDLYGRGTSDAKGQIVAHLWGIRAHLAATGRTAPAVNLTVLVEGEEETGSPHLARLVAEHRARLDADLVVYSDTLLWRADHPAVCTSLRGMVNATLEIMGPLRDVHSGAVSGAAPNPILELCVLLASLHDDQGRITLPGFYDTVVEPTERTRTDLAALPFTEQDWLTRTQTRSISGEAGYTTLERLFTRPSLEVLSIVAGDALGVPRGAIPATARADLSIHTVLGQHSHQVADQLRRWVDEHISCGYGHRLTIAEDTAQEPYQSPPDHPALNALTEAMRLGFDAPVGRMGNAGAGPAELLARTIDAPVLFFGTGLPDDHWHGGDEHASITTLLAGAATLAHLWPRLAHHGRA
jgi:acetylornithine deacetylase/succinyl-diaminopimelate desuccinylase-like protein